MGSKFIRGCKSNLEVTAWDVAKLIALPVGAVAILTAVVVGIILFSHR